MKLCGVLLPQWYPQMSNTITFPSHFTLAHYRLTLEALEPLHLPPVVGNALRGGFGHTFKRLVCRQPELCNKSCERGNACPYGYIFETAPPDNSEVLRTFDDVPRPFIIAAPRSRRQTVAVGERLSFDLTLVGRGLDYLPYFIVVFEKLGQAGLGRDRGRYRLRTVEAIQPFQGKATVIYQDKQEASHPVETTLTGVMVADYAATLPADRLSLEFLTPARLKHQGQWVGEGPSLAVLIKALLNRVSSLSYFHCGQIFETDFKGMIERASQVQTVRVETRWEDWSRVSGRQHQRIEMGGLVGRVMYEGDLTEYLPLLALGELIHVGKGTVFGNGQYQIL